MLCDFYPDTLHNSEGKDSEGNITFPGSDTAYPYRGWALAVLSSQIVKDTLSA